MCLTKKQKLLQRLREYLESTKREDNSHWLEIQAIEICIDIVEEEL